jgi:multidrug efflux pump subunit AcrB
MAPAARSWGDRDRTQKQVLQTLQPLLLGLPGVSTFAIPPPALPGSSGGAPVQFVIPTTGDYKQLAQVLADIQDDARKSGLFIFTDSDLKFDTPQFEMKIDTDKANRLGVSMSDVGGALATLLGGNYVNRFSLYGRSYQVIPQAPRDFRLTSDWLLRYQVRASNGELVPLSTIATVSQTVQPNALTSFQQMSSATLSGVPFPGRTIGETVEFLKKEAVEKFPEGYNYDWQGDARQYVQEGNNLAVTFIFALIVIFLVLAAQFESFRDPLIILIALPTSMFGAMLPMLVGSMMPPGVGGPFAGLTMNIYSQIGLVTLIGLISKHGILMVDFANHMQDAGMSRREAIEHAAGVRLRPILMTTAAMVVGMIPLVIADGAGARSRIAIGMVIAFGMAIGTMFTLFVTPAVYTLLSRERNPGAPSRVTTGGHHEEAIDRAAE